MTRTLLSALMVASVLGCGQPGLEVSQQSVKGERNWFEVERLVSNDVTRVPAEHTDPLLKNAWGLAAGPVTMPTFWWVANNGTGTSTLYDGEGGKQSLEVSVPGAPTGLVFSGGDGFVVTDGTNRGPARFIFA